MPTLPESSFSFKVIDDRNRARIADNILQCIPNSQPIDAPVSVNLRHILSCKATTTSFPAVTITDLRFNLEETGVFFEAIIVTTFVPMRIHPMPWQVGKPSITSFKFVLYLRKGDNTEISS